MNKEVLKRPILTEKATLQAEKGIYTFEVMRETNKIEVAKAVKSKFAVEVKSVQTMWQKEKHKTQFTRKGVRNGVKGGYKKAVVHLMPGHTIDLFSPMEVKDK